LTLRVCTRKKRLDKKTDRPYIKGEGVNMINRDYTGTT